MPNTVLGKVSVVPKGDYSASTTYYALDIVGYNGGSYLAMQEVTGVTPSNDQTNWMQLSGPGLPGVDGVTFTPSVSEAGVISWTNDGEEENPDPVNIMGPPGAAAGFGTVTATADNTSSETPSVDVQSSGPDTAKNFTFAFSGLKGKTGETPDIEIGTVNTLEPGQDATADITGTTPNLTLSLGIPKGQPGTSVSRIQRTSGTGAAGTTDTYTMYDSNDDAIGTFTVYNGANGAGAGDMMADGSVPMTGPLNMGGNKITNLGAPGADTDAVRKSDLDAVAAEVDGILDGTTPAHLAPATDTKIGGVIIGEGLSVEADGTLSADDQLPAGGTQGQVLTQGTTGPEWQDAPSGLPDGGAPGQLLSKTESGAEWVDKPVMYVTVSGTTSDKSSTEIIQASINGYAVFAVVSRLGALYALPLATQNLSGQAVSFMIFVGDRIISCYIKGTTATVSEIVLDASRVTFAPGETGLTADNVQDAIEEVQGNIPTDYVPTSRTVNGKALSQDISLAASDVGARPDTWTPSASDVGALPTQTGAQGQLLGFTANNVVGAVAAPTADSLGAVPTSRTVNGKALSQNITLDAEDVGAMPPPTRLTVTLNASSWSGNSQTITVNGVITNTSAQDIDISCADKASADAWAAGGVWCSNPTQANRLTFTCTTPPTANINLRIRLWEVGG